VVIEKFIINISIPIKNLIVLLKQCGDNIKRAEFTKKPYLQDAFPGISRHEISDVIVGQSEMFVAVSH
jgi:hypothetical protein